MTAGPRYVVLALGRPRAPWLGLLAQWATASSIPVELLKCVSEEELRARLASGRPFSAAMVDGSLAALDRDMLSAIERAGAAALVVDDRGIRDWEDLGASAVLGPAFGRDELLESLRCHATVVESADELPEALVPVPENDGAGARVLTVCGPGGTGASTVAVALAQGLADDLAGASARVQGGAGVVLADLARHSEQAMLHDAGDVVPGVQELVEMHRMGRPTQGDIRALTFDVIDRGYHLLLGLRRARAWSSIRPRAFEVAFRSLCAAYQLVVCDTNCDFEGERDGGSIDVEERNVMSRTCAREADLVVVVGCPGMKGLHGLARVVSDLLNLGVAPDRLVPVLNRAPRSQRARAEQGRALASLVTTPLAVTTPVFLADRNVEDDLRDGVRLPSSISGPLAGACNALLGAARSDRRGTAPERIVPGSLGSWGDGEDATEADDRAAL